MSWFNTTGNLSFSDLTTAEMWAITNPSLVYDGLLATIGGSAYIWTSGVWVAAAGSGAPIIPCFDTIALRNAAFPSPELGRETCIKRALGAGYFEQRWNGTYWEASDDSAIAKFPGNTSIIASASGSYIQMLTANIGGILVDGDQIMVECRANGGSGTNSSLHFDIDGVQVGSTINSNYTSSNSARRTMVFTLRGNTLEIVDATPMGWANVPIYTRAVTPGSLSIGAGIFSGGVGWSHNLTNFVIRKWD